jgi:DNA-binding NtrC family response regulator
LPAIHALHCRLPFAADELHVALWSGTPATLATPPPHGAAAYIVRNTALSRLRALGDVFINRGTKHKARSLASLLLGQPRVPFIAGTFTSVGQLRRSVRTLLQHAAKRHERNTFVIGIDDGLFEDAGRHAGRRAGTNALDIIGAQESVRLVEPEEIPDALVEKLIGDSPSIDLVRQRIVLACAHAEPVLILGETGTGKEVAARAIHELAPERRPHTFMPVNCGAISPELFESELFGYERGAFTGARREGKKGLWEISGNGTLFLDEIGDLPLAHQVKILRALEGRTIRPVGGTREVPVRCRVIAATNRDLYSMMQSGDFREDLYYRLRPVLIHMPPLREHPQDVQLLAQHFWSDVAQGRSPLSGAVLGALSRYRWPGNARELRAVLVSLATTFRKLEPRPEHVRAVFQVHGPSGLSEEALNATDEASIHQSECRRHLWHVEEAVLACKVLLKPFAAERPTADRVRHVRAALAQRIADLHLLEGRPALFHRLATFDVVHQFLTGLLTYRTTLDVNAEEAQRFWKRQLAGALKTTLAAVGKERERLLKS